MDVLEADLRKGCSILFDVLHTTILGASLSYGSSKGLVPDLQSISLLLKNLLQTPMLCLLVLIVVFVNVARTGCLIRARSNSRRIYWISGTKLEFLSIVIPRINYELRSLLQSIDSETSHFLWFLYYSIFIHHVLWKFSYLLFIGLAKIWYDI